MLWIEKSICQECVCFFIASTINNQETVTTSKVYVQSKIDVFCGAFQIVASLYLADCYDAIHTKALIDILRAVPISVFANSLTRTHLLASHSQSQRCVSSHILRMFRM